MTLIVKSNPSTVANVLIRDMGILIPFGGAQETLSTADEGKAASSIDLRNLAADDAFGAGSSTLILNDGVGDIPQGDADAFLRVVTTRSGDPAYDPIPRFDRAYGLFQSNASYIANNSTSFASVTEMVWTGTDDLAVVPTKVRLILSSNKAGDAEIQITDITNAVTIALQQVAITTTSSVYEIPITGALSAGLAVWDLAIRKVANQDGTVQVGYFNIL